MRSHKVKNATTCQPIAGGSPSQSVIPTPHTDTMAGATHTKSCSDTDALAASTSYSSVPSLSPMSPEIQSAGIHSSAYMRMHTIDTWLVCVLDLSIQIPKDPPLMSTESLASPLPLPPPLPPKEYEQPSIGSVSSAGSGWWVCA